MESHRERRPMHHLPRGPTNLSQSRAREGAGRRAGRRFGNSWRASAGTRQEAAAAPAWGADVRYNVATQRGSANCIRSGLNSKQLGECGGGHREEGSELCSDRQAEACPTKNRQASQLTLGQEFAKDGMWAIRAAAGLADEAKLSFWDALVVVFLAYAFRACPGVLVIEGTRVIITVIVVSRSAGCRQAAPSKAGARSPERANQVTLHLAHLRPDGSQRGFQIAGEAKPRGRELRAAQRTAIRVRISRPSRAPQLTPAPLARTSPSSTARPGEKCWPASMRTPRRNMERLALSPCRRSWNPITGRNERAR